MLGTMQVVVKDLIQGSHDELVQNMAQVIVYMNGEEVASEVTPWTNLDAFGLLEKVL